MSNENSIKINTMGKSICYNVNSTFIPKTKTNESKKENYLKKLDETIRYIYQRNIENNRNTYTKSEISERIKKEVYAIIESLEHIPDQDITYVGQMLP
jgi:hypothetical protein